MQKTMWSNKQQKYLLAEDKRINLLHGSVRSGKTYISLLKFALWVGEQPLNQEFMMIGSTLTTLKRNCLGLLENLVGTNNFSFVISQKKALLFGHTVWLEGANDVRAEKKIRGGTLKGAYIDELTLIPEAFYKMLLSRLSVSGAKLIATTNPDNPNNYVNKDIIENKKIDSAIWKFVIDDNIFLDPEYVRQIKNEYTGVYYDRFILGEWVRAEGLIYRVFAENHARYVINDVNKYLFDAGQQIIRVSFGVDFGGTKSATTFAAVGTTRKGVVILLDERYIKEDFDDSIIEDMEQKRAQAVMEYQNGLIDAVEYWVRVYNYTEEEAQNKVSVMNARKQPAVTEIDWANIQ